LIIMCLFSTNVKVCKFLCKCCLISLLGCLLARPVFIPAFLKHLDLCYYTGILVCRTISRRAPYPPARREESFLWTESER
jgi:hypothetical protein